MRPKLCLPLLAVLLATPALEAQPFAYVTAAADDSIGVVDLADGTLSGSFPLSGLPSGAALSYDGTRLFVAQSQLDSLAVIDTATGALSSIPVGATPTGVAVVPRGRRVYVANTSDNTVSAIDTLTGVVVATIPVGAGPLDVIAGGTRVYVANWDAGTVSVVDWTSDAVVATVPVGTFPAALALHEPSERLYVANFFDDTVSVVDTGTLAVVATVPVGRRPRGLALDPAAGRLYVAGFEDGDVSVVATATNTVVLQSPSGGQNPVDVLLAPDRTRLYVAHLGVGKSLAVLDAATLTPLGPIEAPAGPLSIAGYSDQAPPLGLLSRRLRQLEPRASARSVARPPRPRATTEVTISDGTFAPVDWAVSGTGEHDTTQVLSGGNPGAWRQTTHFAGSADTLTIHRLIRPGSQYDPASQGAVASIDASWDRRVVASDAYVSEGLLVEQDSVVYRTTGRFFVSTAWQHDSRTGLTAADFDEGTGGHPDFGPAAPPLRFGYFRRTSFDATITHGIDNFSVTVYPAGGNPAGQLGFSKSLDAVEETDTPWVYVRRVGGTQGAVSVEMRIERPDGNTSQQTVAWADGDGTDQLVVVHFLHLPDGSGARTARLTLLNPTGGATIAPARGAMAITVFPESWPTVLKDLYLRLQVLLGAFSPGWLLLLAVPAMLLSARRKRAGARRRV